MNAVLGKRAQRVTVFSEVFIKDDSADNLLGKHVSTLLHSVCMQTTVHGSPPLLTPSRKLHYIRKYFHVQLHKSCYNTVILEDDFTVSPPNHCCYYFLLFSYDLNSFLINPRLLFSKRSFF